MTVKRETENEQDPRRNLPGNQEPKDVVSTPSQAEGDRETVEADLAQQDRRQAPAGSEGDRDPGGQGDIRYTPSQAEGDRETVEQSLREKEQRDQRRQNEQDSQNKPAVY